MTNTLDFQELEEIYDRLANAIDAAGSGRESLFLAKLCLTLAHHVSDRAIVERAIEIAAADLDS